MNRSVVAASLALFAFAFWMGAAYFQVRRVSTHVTRLENLLKKSPTVDREMARRPVDWNVLSSRM